MGTISESGPVSPSAPGPQAGHVEAFPVPASLVFPMGKKKGNCN
jgi:hypothetical protein